MSLYVLELVRVGLSDVDSKQASHLLLLEMYLEWIESISPEVVQRIKRHADVEVQSIFEAHHVVCRVIMSLKFNTGVK